MRGKGGGGASTFGARLRLQLGLPPMLENTHGNANPAACNLGNHPGTGVLVPFANRTLNGDEFPQHFCPF